MPELATRLLLIALSILIVRIGTIALQETGLPHHGLRTGPADNDEHPE